MTPIRGWAPRGQKLVARAPFGHWRTLTFLAALRDDRIDAPCVLDGPINGVSFTTWVEQFLVPTLAPGDIVIMRLRTRRCRKHWFTYLPRRKRGRNSRR